MKRNRVPFWDRVNKTEGCWLWTGPLNGSGYGTFSKMGVHRYSYILHVGEIPDGLCVCHTCDVRNCINPNHLFLGTYSDNAQDCSRKGRANGEARAHHGEGHGMAKLTWELVREIRFIHPAPTGRGRGRGSKPTMEETAIRLGVTSGLVSQVVAQRIWREEVMPNV